MNSDFIIYMTIGKNVYAGWQKNLEIASVTKFDIFSEISGFYYKMLRTNSTKNWIPYW